VCEHDPEKCEAVFRKDYAQSKTWGAMTHRAPGKKPFKPVLFRHRQPIFAPRRNGAILRRRMGEFCKSLQ
jgi:hypothetical protein